MKELLVMCAAYALVALGLVMVGNEIAGALERKLEPETATIAITNASAPIAANRFPTLRVCIPARESDQNKRIA